MIFDFLRPILFLKYKKSQTKLFEQAAINDKTFTTNDDEPHI